MKNIRINTTMCCSKQRNILYCLLQYIIVLMRIKSFQFSFWSCAFQKVSQNIKWRKMKLKTYIEENCIWKQSYHMQNGQNCCGRKSVAKECNLYYEGTSKSSYSKAMVLYLGRTSTYQKVKTHSFRTVCLTILQDT